VDPSGRSAQVILMTAAEIDVSAREARADAELAIQSLLRLQAVTASLAGALTPAEVSHVVVEQGLGLLDAVAGSVLWATTPDGLEVLDAFGHGEEAAAGWRCATDALPPPLRDAYRTGRPVWLESGAARVARYPGEAAPAPLQGASAVLPLVAGSRVRGVLAIDFDGPRAFVAAERSLVQAVADQSAQALERAHLFAEQQRLRAAAEQGAALLDTLLSAVPIGLAFVDPALRFVHANAAWARLHGRPVEAFAGRTVAEAMGAGPGAARDERWRRVLSTGVPSLDVEEGRTDPDTAEASVWLESCYRVSSRRAAGGLAVVAREITPERRAEEFRRNLLGIVGHDLRNPLAAIVGFARVLTASGELDERRLRTVGRIEACAGQAAHIANDLLDLTRIESGRGLSMGPRPARVDAICADVAAEAESACRGSEVRVTGVGDPDVRWDPARVGQALSNLVVNALKHGTPDRPVTIAWDGTGDPVRVRVHNWGPPIRAELLEHLFEPLRQGGGAGTRACGVGLGLYIASEIARAHGGALEVRSDEASGTEFTLQLWRDGRR
jgi:signal transduction histidine kinase